MDTRGGPCLFKGCALLGTSPVYEYGMDSLLVQVNVRVRVRAFWDCRLCVFCVVWLQVTVRVV